MKFGRKEDTEISLAPDYPNLAVTTTRAAGRLDFLQLCAAMGTG
jgi:hypothetical protein